MTGRRNGYYAEARRDPASFESPTGWSHYEEATERKIGLKGAGGFASADLPHRLKKFCQGQPLAGRYAEAVRIIPAIEIETGTPCAVFSPYQTGNNDPRPGQLGLGAGIVTAGNGRKVPPPRPHRVDDAPGDIAGRSKPHPALVAAWTDAEGYLLFFGRSTEPRRVQCLFRLLPRAIRHKKGDILVAGQDHEAAGMVCGDRCQTAQAVAGSSPAKTGASR